ncbi:MAG TPA: helix-turn-helix domain-containing protein [Terriglobia bacterium]|nr:helix-turn-helix domain-containing protein [Terriglobia bacterium]
MSDSQNKGPGVEVNEGMPAPTSPRKKKTAQEKIEAQHRYRMSLRAPKTPLMLSPHQAWRLICAKTGGSIAKSTFVRWIRDGKVPAVRLGRKIFVPIKMLNDLIEQCLNGESLM